MSDGDRPDFDSLYSGTPPWDIGRPQPDFLALPTRALSEAECST